jgi:acyl-CoA thioesterase FadM
MYPLIRLISSSFKSRLAKKISIFDVCETQFRCRPWDLDMFMEVNNGRLLTLYDLGRFDLAIRSGLAGVLIKNRWGLVVAGSSVRYRRRVRMFDKVTMRTQVVGQDEKWTYIAQSIRVKDRPTSSILLRTGVTAQGGVIPTDEVAAAMGLDKLNTDMPPWVKAWIEADAERVWPPEP